MGTFAAAKTPRSTVWPRIVLAGILMFAFAQARAANPSDWWVDVTNDRASRVQTMLANGADPNEIGPDGNPALMLAIRNGAWRVYDVLLQHPATAFNAINTHRETALMYLAVIGETDKARDLIRRGALVNRKGWTPLHYAASTGKLDTVTMLLDHKADVNAQAADGTTPLMMAAYAGSEPVVRELLARGADVTRRTNQDYSAVDWAGFKSHTTLARKLDDLMQRIAQGSDPTAQASALFDAPAVSKATPAEENTTSRYFDLERFNEPATP